jgi:uncharacterized protein YhaN
VKILELSLTSFGPFTNRKLDLSAGNQGLHVIFGPNEAGKSAALRALHALLFGIPAQTGDAFLHPYDALRLGGRLRLSSGEQIDFVRRKGTKNTLLAPDNSRLDDHALDRFLGGIGPDQFRMFWGIDHARLVQGGREILEGRGDLGESLFAAGLGASHLGALRTKLDEEAASLFLLHGRSRIINKDIALLKELKSAQREATVSAEQWVRQNRALSDAEAQLTNAIEALRKLSREKARLERVKRVLPLLAGRSDLCRRIADLGDVVLLSEDFAKRRQEAETKLSLSQQRLDRAIREFHEQQQMVADLGSTPLLATMSDGVNDLYQRLGSHRKALRDRPGLSASCGELRTQARRLLGEIRPDVDIKGAEKLRIFVGRGIRIQKLAGEHERLVERLDLARQRHGEANEQSKELISEASTLPTARDSDALTTVIEETRRRGNVEAERDKAARSAERLHARRDALVEKLQLSKEVAGEVGRLRMPPVTLIQRFEREARNLEDEGREIKTERQRITKTIRDLNRKIESFQSKNVVPTEEDLVEVRARRDTAFRLLYEHWEKNRDVTAEARRLLGKGKLIELYSDAVKGADDVADRLWKEADRVAELAQYLEQQDRAAKDSEEADAASLRRENAIRELDRKWRKLWTHVLASPPEIEGARAWREDFVRLTELSEDLVAAREQWNELSGWIKEQSSSLRAAMKALEPKVRLPQGLAATLAAADRLRKRVENESAVRTEHERRMKDNNKTIREAQKAESAALEEMEAWQSRWIEAVQGLAQGNAPQPDDALHILEGIERVMRALDEGAGYETRVTAIDQEAASFRGDVRALAEQLHETATVPDGSEDTWVEALHEHLVKVLQEEDRRRQAKTKLDELRTGVDVEQEAVDSAKIALEVLRKEARCGADGDLIAAQRRSEELRALQVQLTQIEKNLASSGDGATIAELEAEAAGVDKDAIAVRLTQITTELQDAEKAQADSRDARTAAQMELKSISGPSAASEKAEEVQATLARLRVDTLRYARLRLASALLTRRIEDYRRRNQAPLLLRAADFFRDLTLGGFERLEADVTEDRPTLVGIRQDGSSVPAHDGMSEGTRDQLFLALRLATVEASCDSGEPMPFVVDDVLIQFDDDRGAAALRVLSEMAARTQVVLFTHHTYVRSCAEAMTPDGMVFVHEL